MSELSLIVLEDHPILRKSTALALQTLGYEGVLEAANGVEALHQLRQLGGVDIAICDVRMPEMDGMTFLRIAAQERLIRAVILVSEVSAELRRAMLHLAGMHKLQVLGELGKPVCLSTLGEQINTYCNIESPSPHNNLFRVSADAVHRALENQEFEVNFQPKVNLNTGIEYGCEALIRWKHSEYGELSPASFLEQVRINNLQLELSKVVLEKSLRFISSDNFADRSSSISINLEIADLQHPDLVNHVENRLRHYQVPARALVFEVTEGELDHSPAVSLESLIRLRLMGCGISIDDFGTGYSSLQRLCDMPCTEIKLDASFVRRMNTSIRAREAISSTISLARHLQLGVVAEGIETAEQLASLRALGCDAGQGYLFARPMPVDEYLRWRNTRRPQSTAIASADIR